MRCEEFLRELDESGRITSPAARAHADGCPACARAAESWQAVRGELRAMGGEAPPPFLHARVMAHVRAEAKIQDRLPWWARVPRWAWASQALALLLGVTLAGWGLWHVRASRNAADAVVAEKEGPAASQDLQKGAPGEDRGRLVAPAEAPSDRPAARESQAAAPPPARKALRVKPQPPAVPVAAAPQAVGGAEYDGVSGGVPGGVPGPEPVVAEKQAAGEPAAKDERVFAEEMRVAEERPVVDGKRDQAAAAGAPAASDAGMPVLGAAKSKILPVRRERPVLPCLATRIDAPGRVAFWLTDDLAPQPGDAIAFEVRPDGAIVLATARDREQAQADVLAARLRAMRLPPGRYRLTRVTQ